jgi:RNA polymerase sigma factor (sigma-70 family)
MGEIDDLVQEIWAGLLANDGHQLRGWDAGKGASLENYVGLIARRKTLNALEHSRAQRRGGGQGAAELDEADGPPVRPSGVIYQRDQLVRLADHLRAHLPERGWLVFRLHFTDGNEVPDVARALNVSAQVVYNWVFRIRQEAQAWQAAQEAEPQPRSTT